MSKNESTGALEALILKNNQLSEGTNEGRRQFLKYAWQLSLFSYITSIHQTLRAKPTYNIAFWRLSGSVTPFLVSEISASIALIDMAKNLQVSELNASVAVTSASQSLQISELSASVAAKTSTVVNVSEIYLQVVGK